MTASDGGNSLESSDYDPIDHLNAIFVRPSSLTAVPQIAESLTAYQNALDDEILDALRHQAIAEEDSLQRIRTTQVKLAALFAKVDLVQRRAIETEESITNMTADIKRLDTTKKNLTLSMTELKRLQMLTTAYEQLLVAVEARQYGDCAVLLQAVIELMAHFNTYRSIDQIAQLSRNIASTQQILLNQIQEDLEFAFTEGQSVQSRDTLQQACLVTDAMSDDARAKLINWYCNSQLGEYRRLFRNTEEAGSLENLSMRYSWFKRLLKAYDSHHTAIFPPAWHVGEVLSRVFCTETCEELRIILIRSRQTLNVDLLLRCLQETMEFETMLDTRFTPLPTQSPALGRLSNGEFERASSQNHVASPRRSSRDSTFGHPISQAFEPYLNLWIEVQERELTTKLTRFKREPLLPPDEDFTPTTVAPSSIELILFYQKTFGACATLSPGQNLLELSRVFASTFDAYARIILLSPLQASAHMSSGSIASSQPVIILPSNLDALPSATSSSITLQEISLLTNTADYCYQECEKLARAIKSRIRADLAPQIDFSQQADQFLSVNTAVVHTIIRHIDQAILDAVWREMRNINWLRVETVTDQSSYVAHLVEPLIKLVDEVRVFVTKSSLLGVFYMTLQSHLLGAFLANVWLCKPVGEVAAEQMLLDLYAIKGALESLNPSANVYKSRVAQSTTRINPLLKTLQVRPQPPEALVQAYLLHIADRNEVNFRRFCELKGLRAKGDLSVTSLVELFKVHRAAAKYANLEESSSVFAPMGSTALGPAGAHTGEDIQLSSPIVTAAASAVGDLPRFSAIMSAAREGMFRSSVNSSTLTLAGGGEGQRDRGAEGKEESAHVDSPVLGPVDTASTAPVGNFRTGLGRLWKRDLSVGR